MTTQPAPIAIVGIGCRFPGAIGPQAFWQLLHNGTDAITEIPPSRQEVISPNDLDSSQSERSGAQLGGFLEQVDQFDCEFFKISPREAVNIDPQQRVLLEVSWEALENAGLSPEKLWGSQGGVFVGISNGDYSYITDNVPITSAYQNVGNAFCITANRLSYFLDWHGPSWAVDTACSSSLVAVHQACQSLRLGECNIALAAGVNLILRSKATLAFAKAKMLAPDGHCKAFDARADGYVRGEGVGVVVLKLLSDAVAHRDTIYAVIRGSAVNQDGLSSGLMAPNLTAQVDVLRTAYQQAQINPAHIDYIEAHGTGTKLGDPIELRALARVLSEGRSPDDICSIGSVKTNIGHLEPAAGIAGLIKVALSLHYQKIPASLHFQKPNPYVRWASIPLRVQQELTPWPQRQDRSLAGVSAFGFGGTNAHVVLETAPPLPAVERNSVLERPLHLLTLSGNSEKAVLDLVALYQAHLEAYPKMELTDICYTANTGRSHFNHRLVLLVNNRQELQTKLSNWGSEKIVEGSISGYFPEDFHEQKIAFLFSGQGSQYAGMAQLLHQTQPIFRQALNQCDQILQDEAGWSLLNVLYPQTDQPEQTLLINQTRYTQPALFAIEYALYQLWRSWGISPTIVMGHSIGEIVAACVAGVFSLKDGLRLTAKRGELMQQLSSNGAMVAVRATAEQVSAIIGQQPKVTIAAFNGPESIVISGETAAVENISQQLETQGIKTKQLQVSHAFHSPLMAPMLSEFKQAAQQVNYSLPKLKLISNVTGQVVTEEVTTPDYWCKHILSSVNFTAGMESLQQEKIDIFLECGPQPILLGMGRQCLPENEAKAWLPSLRSGQSDWQQILSSLGELYVQGVNIDWMGFDKDYPQRRKVSLPTYPFQRKRYWVKTASAQTVNATANSSLHPLLNKRLLLAGRSRDIFFEICLSADNPAYLSDHCVLGQVILPGAVYIEMALAAGASVFKSSCLVLETVLIIKPLILTATQTTQIQVVLSPAADGTYNFEIASLQATLNIEENSWTVHASGKVGPGDSTFPVEKVQLEAWSNDTTSISLEPFYQQARTQGFHFGKCFQSLQQVQVHSDQGYAQVKLPPTEKQLDAECYHLHPIFLDGGFQLSGLTLSTQNIIQSSALYLPVAIDRLELYCKSGHQLWVKGDIQATDPNVTPNQKAEHKSNLLFVDPMGMVVAKITGFKVRPVSRQSLQQMIELDLSDWFYQVTWQTKPLALSDPAKPDTKGHWLLFSTGNKLEEHLIETLQRQGHTCIQIFIGSHYQQLSATQYQVNPLKLDNFQTVLQACCNQPTPINGIIHLWSLENTNGDSTLELGDLQEAQINGCGSVLHLLQALSPNQIKLLWLVTQGAQFVSSYPSAIKAQYAPLWGLGRVIDLEYPDLRCQRLDLDPDATLEANLAAILTEIQATGSKEKQVAYRQNHRLVARLARQKDADQNIGQFSTPQGQPYQLKLAAYGSPDNLRLQSMTRCAPGAGEVEIQMRAVGLNFRDVLKALGVLKEYYARQFGITDPQQLTFGFEGVGRVKRIGQGVRYFQEGDNVMVLLASNTLSSHITVPAEFVLKKPQHLNDVDAATLPLVFLTAYYGLEQLAQLQPGERVLIHAAAGGVGQAAIQIAQRRGAEIYATASPGKWDFLRAQGIQHIFNSRTLEFASQIKDLTHGTGIDVVLNSLSGDSIPKSLEILNKGGRFVEIGKAGIWSAEQVKLFRPDVAYFPFDLGEVLRADSTLIQTLFMHLQQAFESKELQPLYQQVYPIERVVEAFRLMQRGQHRGKVVITLNDVNVDQKQSIHPQGSYLITGGYGALGLQVAQWLVDQGARHLVLVGRSGQQNLSLAAKATISSLEQTGTRVQIKSVDVSNWQAMSDLLSEIETSMPPLRGVFHTAGVLEDGLLKNQNWYQFERVMAPKIQGTLNLHRLTQHQELEFFICFSSIAAVMGNVSQGNYAAANAFMDALMIHRRAQGLPGLSIQWGPWSQSGMAARMDSSLQTRMEQLGLQSISAAEGCQTLGKLLAEPLSNIAVASINWPRVSQQVTGTNSAFLEALLEQEKSFDPHSEFRLKLQSVSVPEQKQLLRMHIQQEVARVSGFSASEMIDPHRTLFDLGLDSLMIIELRNRLQSTFGKGWNSDFLLENPSIEMLVLALIKEVVSQNNERPNHELQQSITTPQQQPKLIPLERDGSPIPLSYAQEDIILRLEGTSIYNIPATLRIKGALDIQILQEAINQLVARHEILRTTFPQGNGIVMQQVATSQEISLNVINESDLEVPLIDWLAQDAKQPFDLAVGPLVRLTLVRLHQTDAVLVMTMHHIISDGWSIFRIFWQDMVKFYESIRTGQPSTLSPLPFQYADYAVWQRKLLQSGGFEPQLAYWEKQITMPWPKLTLPVDYTCQREYNFNGDIESFSLSIAKTQALETLSASNSVTLFTTLFTVVQLLVWSYSHDHQFCIGTYFANRNPVELMSLIGVFINLIPLVCDLSDEPTYPELLSRNHTVVSAALENSDVPLELILEEIFSQEELSHLPELQVAIVFHNEADSMQSFTNEEGLTFCRFEEDYIGNGATEQHWGFHIFESPLGLKVSLEYATDLYSQDTILQVIDTFQSIVDILLKYPNEKVLGLI